MAESMASNAARALASEAAYRVRHAAAQGAKQILVHQDAIQEAASEVVSKWIERLEKGDPPESPENWAFVCGKNYALHELRMQARFVEMPDDLSETLGYQAPGNVDLESPSAFQALTADEAAQAIRDLLDLTNRIIQSKADALTKRIVDYHYLEHLTFAEIAVETGLSEAAVRKRWSRLLWTVADDLIAEIRADAKLSSLFSALLNDRQEFRTAILGLFSIVSAKGFPAIQAAAVKLLGS
jgi:RNA polymerase sigma factor (sigma-70 family)